MFLLECLPRNYLGEDFSNFDDRIFIDGWMFFFLGGIKDIRDGDSSWWFSNPKQKSRAPNLMFGNIRGEHWMITLYLGDDDDDPILITIFSNWG